MINTVTHIDILTRYYLCIYRFASERMISNIVLPIRQEYVLS